MILAAGRGERMRPLTDQLPKPLLQVAGISMIERHLFALSEAKFKRVIINISYLGEKIRRHLGSGADFGLELIFSEEIPEPLETAGGIKNALPLFNSEEILVINGDIVTDIPFDAIKLPSQSNIHLMLVDNPPHHPNGDFCLEQNPSSEDNLLGISDETDPGRLTYSGVGCYRLSLFDAIPQGKSPLAPIIKQQAEQGKATAFHYPGMWIDVGTVDRLKQADSLLSRQKMP